MKPMNLLHDLIREVAANEIMPYFLRVQSARKEDGSVLSQADLAAQIERIEANATRAGSFWAHLVYLIEDDFFYSRLPLSQYMEDGRWGG